MDQGMLYQRFERFWHWLQALLIILLMITGFNVHDSHRLFGFAQAADYHIVLAWILVGLWVFAVFWHLVTGEWRQYTPSSRNKILAMAHYYTVDIFLGGGHPYHRTRQEKHNPLQRITYLLLHVLIFPVIWCSGWLLLFYDAWGDWGFEYQNLGAVAVIHTAASFAILVFLIIHLYLALTVSATPLGNVKAMITGYEDEEEEEDSMSRET